MSKNYTEIKGWKYLFGPYWWTGEDAMWVRQAKDKAWWVLRFTDLLDAGGKDFKDTPYECSVKRIDFDELPPGELVRALRSCGYRVGADEGKPVVINEYDGAIVAEGDAYDLCLVECCIQYGFGAPLHDEVGKRWLNVRGRARKVAEEMMRSASELEAALDRPVNKIGSTAREYGNGDINSALHRGPFDTGKNIIRKMHGLPEGSSLSMVSEVTNMRHADIRKCPHMIILPEHYRLNGTCKCNDKVHRQKMIEEWGYTEKDFEGMPILPATPTSPLNDPYSPGYIPGPFKTIG